MEFLVWISIGWVTTLLIAFFKRKWIRDMWSTEKNDYAIEIGRPLLILACVLAPLVWPFTIIAASIVYVVSFDNKEK